MKNNILKSSLVIVLALTIVSFTTITEKSIKINKSDLSWTGYKVTGKHAGTLGLKSGTLSFDGEKLTGGAFTVDMTTLAVTDIQGEYADKLKGHLMSGDFFAVADHPLANITFTNVKSSGKNSYTVNADLTIKNITNPITFEISVSGSKATASLKVDRTKYDIKYGSSSFFDNLQDKAIYDEFDLNVNLTF